MLSGALHCVGSQIPSQVTKRTGIPLIMQERQKASGPCSKEYLAPRSRTGCGHALRALGGMQNAVVFKCARMTCDEKNPYMPGRCSVHASTIRFNQPARWKYTDSPRQTIMSASVCRATSIQADMSQPPSFSLGKKVTFGRVANNNPVSVLSGPPLQTMKVSCSAPGGYALYVETNRVAKCSVFTP